MELRQLRCFVAVAEELHFGRAAEKLLLGQPAVSQQVRRLERELKVELFDRSPRYVRLTPAGDRFLPAARDVLAAEDAARALAADLAAEAATPAVLRLGTITGLGERLDLILDTYQRRAPGVRVELHSAPVRERLARLADGRLDAAFVRGAIPESNTELRFLPVWQDELVLALPARHALAEQPDIDLADLAALPLRLTERRNHPALVDLVTDACVQAGFQPVLGPAHGGTLQDTLAAIGTGTPMWTVVYAANARMTNTHRIAFRPCRTPLTLPTSIAVRRSAPLPRLLLQACRQTAVTSPTSPTSPTRDDQDS
ncbi:MULTISPECIES: LysR family transcriptional regulator [unclassified Kitasatospora]|uniref:LysR family transcriptional regulator n=1 Tax=unclassified Kitasatospora TaxID=2633591 RepID=UPI0034050631